MILLKYSVIPYAVQCTEFLNNPVQCGVEKISYTVFCTIYFTASPFLWGPSQIGNWEATSIIGVIIALRIARPVIGVVLAYIGRLKGKYMSKYS